MPFDIATGTYTEATALQPLDATYLPAVQQPTVTAGQQTGPTVDARDTVGEYQSQLAAAEADARAAQAIGMSAESDRRSHYAGDILPTGAAYGDPLATPVVPEDANGPAADFLFAEGDQPGKGT